MKSINLTSFHRRIKISQLLPVIVLATSYSVTLLAATSIRSQSFSLDIARATSQFNKGIEIINGAVKINASSLLKKNISLKNGADSVEVMQLSGSPVKVVITETAQNRITTIVANDVKFMPTAGILEIQQNTKLSIVVNGAQRTTIKAVSMRIVLLNNKISTIDASGSPLTYQLKPAEGEFINSTARKLFINNQNQQVILFDAQVIQSGNKLQAGEIIVDSKTGNLSASAGGVQKPSFSIDIDNLDAPPEKPNTIDEQKLKPVPTSTSSKNMDQSTPVKLDKKTQQGQKK